MESVSRNADLRGARWMIATAHGQVVTSGSVPALMEDCDMARAGYYIDIAKSVSGDLYLVSPAPIESGGEDDLIFGLTWDQIQAMQQGLDGSRRMIPASLPDDAVLVFSSQAKNVGVAA